MRIVLRLSVKLWIIFGTTAARNNKILRVRFQYKNEIIIRTTGQKKVRACKIINNKVPGLCRPQRALKKYYTTVNILHRFLTWKIYGTF